MRISATTDKKEAFIAQLEQSFGSPRNELQELSRSILQETPAPTVKSEHWKYTSVSKLMKSALSSVLPKENTIPTEVLDEEADTYFFTNGHYLPGFTRNHGDGNKAQTLQVISPEEAFSNPLFSQHFNRLSDKHRGFFSLLNSAFYQNVVCIHVPDNHAVERPVHLIYLQQDESAASFPRVIVVMGKNSKLNLVQKHQSSADQTKSSAFTNSLCEVVLEQNATLDFYKLQLESADVHHISNVFATQKNGSQLHHHTYALGEGWIRNDFLAELQEDHCHISLNGLSLSQEKAHIDHHTLVDHASPNCTSDELYKGIADGASSLVFNGKILVRQHAQKTAAFQSNANILLSANASANAKPELEIYADDVKCSHGSTTGQLDEDALFYLQSRGLSRGSAKRVLIQAFASEVLSRVSNEAVRTELESIISRLLNKKKDA